MLFYSPENYLQYMLRYLLHKVAEDFFDITEPPAVKCFDVELPVILKLLLMEKTKLRRNY